MTSKFATTQTSWSPTTAISKAHKEIADLGIPVFVTPTEAPAWEHLEFADLMNADNRQLEAFLVMYGGYKAYLESQVADCEAKCGALTAAFDEGFVTALHRLNEERPSGVRKPTKDEIRGEIMDRYDQLRELRREVIEQEALRKNMIGLLNTYKAAYDAVSRVVALRTFGVRDER